MRQTGNAPQLLMLCFALLSCHSLPGFLLVGFFSLSFHVLPFDSGRYSEDTNHSRLRIGNMFAVYIAFKLQFSLHTPVTYTCYVRTVVLCLHRPDGKVAASMDREGHAMPSASAASPTTVPPSDRSSDSEVTITAAAPIYPSDTSMGMGQTGRTPNPPPPPPSAPRPAHADHQKLLQQRHKDRLNLHKNQVGFQVLPVVLFFSSLLAVGYGDTGLLLIALA